MTISLRPLSESDKDQILRWRNAPHVAEYMYTNHEISQEEHDKWFARALSRADARFWIIELDGRGIGLANVYAIDTTNRRCSWAFYIGEKDVQGKGVGAFVEYWMLRHVFEVLQLHKLSCEVIETNQAVWEMHQRFGFVREGLLRNHVHRGDSDLNIVVLSMLRSEWLVQKPLIEAKLSRRFVLPAQLDPKEC
jgi:UDP-4-amino-4,6-dideoxy-N-acetyl-beta-L-altrosamine N-acetyltransferase